MATTRSLSGLSAGITLAGRYIGTLNDSQVNQLPISLALTLDIANGTGAGQADRYWTRKDKILTNGTNETLDLYQFSGTDIGYGNGIDPVGLSLTCVDIVIFLLRNKSASGSLILGGVASDPWISMFSGTLMIPALTDKIVVVRSKPGLVVSNTNKNLKITASGADQTFDMYIAGRSTA